MLLPGHVTLYLLQLPYFIVDEVALLRASFILLHNELFELLLTDFTRVDLHDLRLRQVNDILLEHIHEHLVIAVLGLLGKRKIQSLRNVVFSEEVRAELRHLLLSRRIGFREQITRQRLVHVALRRISHGRCQQRLLGFVIA